MESLGLQEACAEARSWNHGDKYFICRRPLSELTARLSQGLSIKTSFAVTDIAAAEAAAAAASASSSAPPRLMRLTSSSGACVLAQSVIIAVPLSQLKRNAIAFRPPLPRCKARAIERIQVGDAIKVFLAFEAHSRPPWPEDVWDVVCPDADAFLPEFWMTSAMRDTDTRSSNRVHVLTGFIAGHYATRLAGSLDERGILARALAQIADIFGPHVRECYRGGRVFHWGQQAFQQAGYSHPSVGALGERAVLAEPLPERRLYFAGEATHEGINPCLQVRKRQRCQRMYLYIY